MAIIRLDEFEESFVIHFGGSFQRINAYTLATTLVGFADAARAANAVINPGHEIEVVVESLGDGSFKAKIKAVYTTGKSLFSGHSLKQVVLELIAAFIIHEMLSKDPDVKVVINTDEVVIEQGNTKVIVPRNVHNAMEEAKKSPAFVSSIGQAFEAVDRDKKIESLGLTPNVNDAAPLIEIPRDSFQHISELGLNPEDQSRVVIETTELQIMKAILERSKRRWEFVWGGVRISAPVTDSKFYDDFFSHTITIAPGDSLKVRLQIRQIKHESGVYLNDPRGYEVVEVLRHIPQSKQVGMEDGGFR